MPSLICRPLVETDITAVLHLDHRCFGGIWTGAGYRREIDSPNSDLWIMALGDDALGDKIGDPSTAIAQASPRHPTHRIIGVGCAWAILEEAHITLLGIDPDFQGRGLGQWMLSQLLMTARDRQLTHATLEVRASNQTAQALYGKFGFQTAGRRRRYYNDDEDALILWRSGLQSDKFVEVLHQSRVTVAQRLAAHGWVVVAPDNGHPSPAEFPHFPKESLRAR